MSCLQDFTFLNINLKTWRMLILFFFKFNFWRHPELVGFGRVSILLVTGESGGQFGGSGRSGSVTKMDPWISLRC